MPKRLNEATVATAKDENVATKRISAKPFLHQQRQTLHPATHIGMASGDPDPYIIGDRDHRNACRMVVTNAADAWAPIVTLAPLPNSTVMTVVFVGTTAAARSDAKTTGAKAARGSPARES